MTTTYDPFHPRYLDESDLRDELVRVYDLCHGCRLCFKFCSSFPTMFEAIDRHDDQDAAKMTAAEQDRVVDECFNCKLCYVNCPYIPGQSEWNLDFPRLMLRAKAVLNETRPKPLVQRVAGQALGRTDLSGQVNSRLAGPVNKVLRTPGTRTRSLLERTIGISAERVLPPFARTRFSTWFKGRNAVRPVTTDGRSQGTVTLFPTCLVEYQAPQVGRDVVRVLERNGVACELPDGLRCCGAPWLHEGDIDNFRAQARRNVGILADRIRAALDRGDRPVVVVPQPTCSYVLKKDYVDYLDDPDARLVSDYTMDSAEYLWSLHKGDDTSLDTEFTGVVPETITYHAPCHLRAQNIGLKGRDVMKLTGAKITLAAECSGIDGMWGYRAENHEISVAVGAKLKAAVEKAGSEVVAGECHLANGGIAESTGTSPQHPLSVLARAYAIPEEG